MRERPILFSSPMVRAILAGKKTQTRRICKLEMRDGLPDPEYQSLLKCCPYGQPGDRLWVRETSRAEELDSGMDGVRYCADEFFNPIENTVSASISWLKMNTYGKTGMGVRGAQIGPWVPSIHMPRWASRILLEIVSVRVERLNSITVSNAIAEGYDCSIDDPVDPSIKWYSRLWEQINGAGSWAANPWVWVVEFRRITEQA